MEYKEYRQYDAVGLAELVSRGDVSPGELLDVAVARAEAVNGRVNAIVRPMYDIARERAGTGLTGPFAGVPFVIKDLGQDYAGLPTGGGSRAFRNHAAPEHSIVVQRWLDAGLVIFGKTNTPELGSKGVTEPVANGPTRNPWNLDHTPGGSSGGAAAAIAAGIVPVAGASDGGGSIRIPAACCGLFGLKPGRGLVPSGPKQAENWHGAATNGVISRSVRDSAAMLDVLAQPNLAGPYLAARPEKPYAELARQSPGKLRIGFSATSPAGTLVHPQAVAAVEDAVQLLQSLGHEVEPANPAVDGKQLALDFLVMLYTEAARTIAEARTIGARPQDFEVDTRMAAAVSRAYSAADYAASLQRWNDYMRALAAFHQTYDVLLTPTIASPPVRIGELDPPPIMRSIGESLLRLGLVASLSKSPAWTKVVMANLTPYPFTQLANLTGRPAMSVPTYTTPQGLPLGVQFVGPLGGEGMLLALGAQIESARPWAQLEPDL